MCAQLTRDLLAIAKFLFDPFSLVVKLYVVVVIVIIIIIASKEVENNTAIGGLKKLHTDDDESMHCMAEFLRHVICICQQQQLDMLLVTSSEASGQN